MKYNPYPYQTYATDFIIQHPGAGLFLDMGMGKSVITLTAIKELQIDKVLIIAPLRPAKEVWPAEIQKWDHLQDLTYSLVLGSEAERLKALERKADIYIINRENVKWLVEYYKQKWPFDCVVIDELSSFKSSKAQRFRALKKVRKYITRIIGLTGTPAPNGLLDLWSQIYLLDEGKALGRTKTSYIEKWFLPDKRSAVTIFSWKPKTGAEEEIYNRLSSCCVSMKTIDYIQLPEQLYIEHPVELPRTVKDQYKALERDMLLPFKDGDIDAPTAGVLVNKLLQLCGGAIYDENGEVKNFHTEKLKMLEQLIEEANEKPVLVYYAYRHEHDRLLKHFPMAVDIKTPGAIDKWNAGQIPILLVHPASAGHGLNLQFGGNIIIWYSPTWSLELYQQANKRLHRIGQKETVLIHHITVKNGIDSKILNTVLRQKEQRQDLLLEALKAEMEEIL
jgi:superfamily II DNA or RNA helicase